MASTAPTVRDELLRRAAGAAALPAFRLHAASWQAHDTPDARTAWDALARCAAEPNPFLESWYLLPALRALDPHHRVRLLRFEAEGDLAGILPMVRAPRYYRWPIPHLAGWSHPNAFLGVPLVAAGLEHRFWRALLFWADRSPRLGLFLHLSEMPLGGPVHLALSEVLEEQSRAAAIVHRAERAMLASDQSPDAYFEASLSGKKRKELRRQLARLSELGEVTCQRLADAADLDEWTEQFLQLEAAGWKGKGGSALASQTNTAAMFRQSLQGAAALGRLERLALKLNGRPIAMLANFITPPGAFSYKTAFDEDFSRFSPGVLLQQENLQVLRRTNIAWTDSCAAAGHPMIDHIWRERRAVGRISIAIGGPLRRALFARLLRAELGRSPTGIVP